jgi:ketosteroid isomerase-like protein
VFSEATAYVTAEYRLKTKMDGKPVDAEGLGTLILVKGTDGAWKIRPAARTGTQLERQ